MERFYSEFSKPTLFPVKTILWHLFTLSFTTFRQIDFRDASAYTYLPESVKHFPSGNDFALF